MQLSDYNYDQKLWTTVLNLARELHVEPSCDVTTKRKSMGPDVCEKYCESDILFVKKMGLLVNSFKLGWLIVLGRRKRIFGELMLRTRKSTIDSFLE